MSDLTTLLSGENAALIGAVVAILSTLKSMFPKRFQSRKVKRFVPLMPIAIALLAVFLGFGEAGEFEMRWQARIVLGCLIGFTAGQLYKAGRTSIFGWGLPDESKPDTPAAAAAEALTTDLREGD